MSCYCLILQNVFFHNVFQKYQDPLSDCKHKLPYFVILLRCHMSCPSTSFCRTASPLLHVSSLFVKKFSCIHCHTGGLILQAVQYSFISNELFPQLNTLFLEGIFLYFFGFLQFIIAHLSEHNAEYKTTVIVSKAYLIIPMDRIAK